MFRFLSTFVLVAGLLASCSKKSGIDSNPNPVDPNPHETDVLKYIPDSMFRVYLKANVCPNAFDATGKLIDISNAEVKNFNGTIQIDTVTCPRPFVSSLQGVQYFTKMKKLIVQDSPVDSLNLFATMQLDTVKLIRDRDMQYVALNGCTNMRYIRIADIPALSVDMSNLPELNYVNLISLSRLVDLKTNNDAKLRHLMVYGLSSLKTVNVSTNSNLGRLYLENCSAINSLDVTHNQKLYGLATTYCNALKSVDLSKNDSLQYVKFDDSGIDTVDFSHNPELYSVVMFRTPIRNLSLLSNPKVCVLWLDGCSNLKTVDLRAQKSFSYWFVPTGDLVGLTQDDMYQIYQQGYFSPVATPLYHVFAQPARAGVNGATTNLFGGLRVPQYLDANGITLTKVKVNKAAKDNYSLVMARRVFASMTPALITVYDDDMTTLLCADYSPELFQCN